MAILPPKVKITSKRRPRVEINPKMQALFRRLAEEENPVVDGIKQVIKEEAYTLEWQITANLLGIGGVDDGYLLASIDHQIGSKGLSAEVGAGATIRNKQDKQWYNTLALWLEYGTRPHTLMTGDSLRVGKKDKLKGIGPRQTGRLHPGQRPRPFVRPAFELRRPIILKRLEEAYVKALKDFVEGSPRFEK